MLHETCFEKFWLNTSVYLTQADENQFQCRNFISFTLLLRESLIFHCSSGFLHKAVLGHLPTKASSFCHSPAVFHAVRRLLIHSKRQLIAINLKFANTVSCKSNHKPSHFLLQEQVL